MSAPSQEGDAVARGPVGVSLDGPAREVHVRALQSIRDFLDSFAAASHDDGVIEELCDDLEQWRRRLARLQVEEAEQVFGRQVGLPARGQTTVPAYDVLTSTRERFTGRVRLGRYWLGGGGAAHGGAVAMLMDEVLGGLASHERPPARTAWLRIDYRALTPVGVDLEVGAEFEQEEGRKRLVRGWIRHGDIDCVVAEGLFIEPRGLSVVS